jgi:hypothetical protein
MQSCSQLPPAEGAHAGQVRGPAADFWREVDGHSPSPGRAAGKLSVFGTLTIDDSVLLADLALLGADLDDLGTVFLHDSTVGVIAP